MLPFRPRKSPFLHFGRNHKKVIKKEEEKTEAPALDLEEEEEDEESVATTVTEKPEETSTRAFKPVRMRLIICKNSDQIPISKY